MSHTHRSGYGAAGAGAAAGGYGGAGAAAAGYGAGVEAVLFNDSRRVGGAKGGRSLPILADSMHRNKGLQCKYSGG